MAAPVTESPAPQPAAAPPKLHRRRFAILYGALVVLAAGGVSAGAWFIANPEPPPPVWTDWKPLKTDSPESTVREIAVHVQEKYATAKGEPFATIRGGPLSVGSDPAVLVKPDAKAAGGYKFFEGASVQYQLCGTTTKGTCAFDPNKVPPNTSGALTRTMAYELALTTFHFVPGVQNVAVLMPTLLKGQQPRILVLTRSENDDPRELDDVIKPIVVKGKPSSAEALDIATRTDALIYHYEVTATSDNQPVYLITPLQIADTGKKPVMQPAKTATTGSTP